MEKNKKLKGRCSLNGKILFRVSGLLIATLIIIVFLLIHNLREYKNSAELDGEKFNFNIYDVDREKISFSRSDTEPKAFKNHKWLPAGALEIGGLYLEKWDDKKLSSFFEVPGKNPSKYVPEIISRININSQVEVVGLVKFKISGSDYLYISLKTSDLPNYTQYSLLKKFKDTWVIPSSKLSSIVDLPKKAKKINDVVVKESENGKVKYSSISSLD